MLMAAYKASEPNIAGLPNWVMYFWRSPEGEALNQRCPPYESEVWDGDIHAIEREPDRVIDVDKPGIVVWNGGGYD
jgi:hypothetical protein